MHAPEVIFEKSVGGEAPLITIAIPTYNRSDLLVELLNQLEDLLVGNPDAARIEVLVSDNASHDETRTCLNGFVRRTTLPCLRIQRHHENVGMDLNFLSLFIGARGSYCWLMSDDDRFVKEGLYELIALLSQSGAPDFVLVNQTTLGGSGKRYFDWSNNAVIGLDGFLSAVKTYATFVGIIAFRRDGLDLASYERFNGTFLLLTYVFCDAVNRHIRGLAMREPAIAYRLDNTGGYALFKVFCDEFAKVLDYAKERGASVGVCSYVVQRHMHFFLIGAARLYRRKRREGRHDFKHEPRVVICGRVLRFGGACPGAWLAMLVVLASLFVPTRFNR